MAKKPVHQPIKRHPQLVKLSRDHHFGLLLVWKIRQGLRKAIDEKRIAAYIVYCYHLELAPHFAQEEDYLLTHLPADDALRLRTEDDHIRIRRAIELLNAAEEIKHQQLEAFASLLEKHIRFEERELFIALEALLDEAALKEIGDALNTSTKQEDTWQDVFWLRD
jgi:hypothetical protein